MVMFVHRPARGVDAWSEAEFKRLGEITKRILVSTIALLYNYYQCSSFKSSVITRVHSHLGELRIVELYVTEYPTSERLYGRRSGY